MGATRKSLLCLGIALIAQAALNALPPPAQAGLSLDADSIVTNDIDALSATRHDVHPYAKYSVHAITDGTLLVSEYVSAVSGQVFAVTWSGTRDPKNLDALFGPLMGEYLRGLKASRAPATGPSGAPLPRIRRAGSIVQTEHLTVERAVHIGNARGRAYLTNLPEGVNLNEIR